ncbi:MAG: radical SAM protein, partial [Chloroflexota bacterium]
MPWRQISMARRLLATEQGASVRDWGGQLPIVLVYPNTYAVGMSSLAMHTLYRQWNALPGVVCERAFAALGRQAPADEPPITLESQRPLADAAVIAFSVSFELDYFNVLDVLARAGVPLRAADRQQGDPYVLLGGPAVSANPMPLAPVADAVVIGEAEECLEALTGVLRESWAHDRAATLAALRRLPGVYVPLLGEDERVSRLVAHDLDRWPTHTAIVAPQAEFGDMYLIEISRGCPHGCRFCLAGHLYRPMRERSLATLLAQARHGMQFRRKLGLVAAAVSDHTEIDALVAGLRQMGAALSVSSLRMRPLSAPLVQALAESGAQVITLAPEAGSERLRRAIHKGVTQDDILAATALVAHQGFETCKLYFMLGLPGETDDDIAELLALVRAIAAIFTRRIVVNLTPFVPKAHTPF